MSKIQKYGKYVKCGSELAPVWFEENESKVENGGLIYTGRKRMNVAYLECINCLHKECVDDETFSGLWHY